MKNLPKWGGCICGYPPRPERPLPEPPRLGGGGEGRLGGEYEGRLGGEYDDLLGGVYEE